MLAHMNIYMGFIEECEKLLAYPEITKSDVASFKFGNFDSNSQSPLHAGNYDLRLFDALMNHVRKIFILKAEPISLESIHDTASVDFSSNPSFLLLNEKFVQIRKYLLSNMNDVMQFSFSYPTSILDTTSVFALLNNYMAATLQHSKPNAQRVISELNALTSGNLPEMVRVMVIDLSTLVTDYVAILRKNVYR